MSHSPLSTMGRLLILIAFCLGAVLSDSTLAVEGDVTLLPDRYAAWWSLGETVSFKPILVEVPASMTVFTATVFDSSGKEVRRDKLARQPFLDEGWSWKPEQPGFYEVEFAGAATEAESATVLPSHFTVKLKDGKIGEFAHDRYQFVIAARQPKPDFARAQFGFSCGLSPKVLKLVKLIGFDFAFIQAIPWGAQFTNEKMAVEPKKGEFHWEHFDPIVEALRKDGFSMAAQFLSTPLWASPCPEKFDKINIGTREALMYAPKDMDDFSNFVREAVKRYKDRIKVWEIWNEPNIPGQSIFWYDTAENYTRLLKAGYKAVKEVQPEAEVWLGGLGPRTSYFEFYNQIQKLGASDSFDILSLHGTWNSPEYFYAIDDVYKAPHRPAIMSEWHAILHNISETGPHPSERELSKRMMLDQLYQFKRGVVRSIFFTLTNGNAEVETTDFFKKAHQFSQTYGIFRSKPRIEPRLAAAIYQFFLAQVGNRVTGYINEYDLGSGAAGVLIDTAIGKQLVIWLEKPTTVKALFPKGLGSSAQLHDWEGRTVPTTGETPLSPDHFYYLSGAPDALWPSLTKAEVLTSPRNNRANMAANLIAGVVNLGTVFDSAAGSDIRQKLVWNDANWNVQTLAPGAVKAPDFNSTFVIGSTEQGIDLVVDVTDAKHVQNETSPAFGKGDSIQFSFDCDGSGRTVGSTDFIAALTPSGPVLWKSAAAQVGGDLPAKWTPADAPVANGEFAIRRENGHTIYRIRLPWSELYPLIYKPERQLRFALVVNNNNGTERESCREWAGGIEGQRNPAFYGVLRASSR